MHQWNTDIPEPSYAETDRDARNLLNYLMQYRRPIGFDTETWGKKLPFKIGTESPLDWMNDTVTFWSLSFLDEHDQFQRWCMQQHQLLMFVPLLENPDSMLVTWNGKYDAHVSWNSGVNVWGSQVIDVMAMALLHDENIPSAGLKECAKHWLQMSMTKFKNLFKDVEVEGRLKEHEISLYDLPLDRVVYYASLDAYATLQLFYFLQELLEADLLNPNATQSASLWDYFLDVEVPITRLLWCMERRGMFVDRQYLTSKIPLIDEEIEKVKKDVNRDCGTVVNIQSPKQLARIFFGSTAEGGMGLKSVKSTATGQMSCDEEVMDILEGQGIPLAAKIVRARKLMKTKSTYLMALLQLANHYEDHRIHPSFRQMGARTGRFSTTQPNSQNFPRPDTDEWGIRKAFVAEPGCRLIVADYEQLEMRIMAHMSQDPRMIKAIRDDLDLHCFTAANMYNKNYDDILAAKKSKEPTPEQVVMKKYRQDAKAIGFGILYGAGPVKIGKELGIPKDEAKKKIDLYLKKTFPGVDSYIHKVQDQCRSDGFVRTISGRRRRLGTDIHNVNYAIRGHAEREAVNATIQGSAADIVKNAMLQIEEHAGLRQMEAYILNQIHDELVIEVPSQYAEEAAAIVKDIMEHPFARGEEALCVPLPVDLHIVDNWAEAKA